MGCGSEVGGNGRSSVAGLSRAGVGLVPGNQCFFHATITLPKMYAAHAIDVQVTIVEQMIFLRSFSHC